MQTLFLTTFCLTFPYLSQRIYRYDWFPTILSPVVTAYLVGILIGNLPFWTPPSELLSTIAGASLLITLPLLLFSVRLEESWGQSRMLLWVFAFCSASAMVATSSVAILQITEYPDGWRLAGMLTGLYSGGTPNLQALGVALEASEETFPLLNAADIIGGGLYLLLLISVVPPLVGRFLRPSKVIELEDNTNPTFNPTNRSWLEPLVAAIIVAGLAVGGTILLFGTMEGSGQTFLIFLVTSLALAASLHPRVRNWKNSYRFGDYTLLIFCVAVGLSSNLVTLAQQGGAILRFSLLAITSTVLLTYLLAWLFRIRRDEFLVGSAAAMYGPIFIPQVVASINRKDLLAPGIAMGLFGIAVGNYLGLAVAYSVRWWVG